MYTVDVSLGKSSWDVKPTTHLEIIPRLRKNGALYPFPYCQYRVVLQHSDNFTFFNDEYSLFEFMIYSAWLKLKKKIR
jgi:hypothetical protein